MGRFWVFNGSRGESLGKNRRNPTRFSLGWEEPHSENGKLTNGKSVCFDHTHGSSILPFPVTSHFKPQSKQALSYMLINNSLISQIFTKLTVFTLVNPFYYNFFGL
jgi:hypothetical protein